MLLTYGVAAAAAPVVGLSLSVIAFRILEPADAGLFLSLTSVIAIGSGTAVQWLSQGVNRFLAATPDDGALLQAIRAEQSRAVAAASILVCLLSLGFALEFQAWRSAATIAFACALAGFASATNAIELSMAQALRRPRQYQAQVFRFQFARLAATAGALLALPTATAALFGAAIGTTATVFTRTGEQRSEGREPTIRAFRRQLRAYGLPFVAWTALSTATSLGDRPFVALTLGVDVAGSYAVHGAVATGLVSLVALPVLLWLHPTFMRSWASGNHARGMRDVGFAVALIGGAGMAISAALAIGGSRALSTVLGRSGEVSLATFSLLVASATVAQVGLVLHKPLEAEGRVVGMVARMLCALVVTVVNAFATASTLGMLGVAASVLSGYATYAAIVSHAAWAGQLKGVRRQALIFACAALSASCALWPIVAVANPAVAAHAIVAIGLVIAMISSRWVSR